MGWLKPPPKHQVSKGVVKLPGFVSIWPGTFLPKKKEIQRRNLNWALGFCTSPCKKTQGVGFGGVGTSTTFSPVKSSPYEKFYSSHF